MSIGLPLDQYYRFPKVGPLLLNLSSSETQLALDV